MNDSSPAPRRDWWHPSRRPLLPATILFCLGIVSHRLLPIRPFAWLSISALLLIAATLFFRRPRLCSACIALNLFLAGLLLTQLHLFCYPPNHISAFTSDEPRLAQLELRILDPPRLLAPPPERFLITSPRQFTSAQVLRILTPTGWQPATGEILVHLSEPHPRLAISHGIRALGLLSRPAPAMNPGQFDWAEHDRRQRILASFSISYAENVTILDATPPALLDRLRQRTRDLLAEGFRADQSLDHSLLHALLLGDRRPELRDVQEDFQRTGTAHHLATSGLHIAIAGLVVFAFCRLLCFPPRLSVALGLLVTILYGLVALPSPPILRSVLLAAAVSLGLLLRRSLDLIHLLALAALLMLICDPTDLYNAGFQLSFGTILGMMIWTAPVENALKRLWKEDRDIAIAQQLAPQWRRTLAASARRKIIMTLAAGIAAWLVSLPLICWHFRQLNPWTIPASIALAPLVFLSVVAGVFKILLTGLFPTLAPLWATLALAPIAAMRHTVDWLARWPSADVPLPAPSLWLITAWYLCLSLPLFPTSAPRLQRALRYAAPIAAALLILLHLTLLHPDRTPGTLRLTILSVGAGQCAVAELPSGKTLLFDAGSDTFSDLHRTCLDPFLRLRGIRTIDALFLSHANTDHFSAAADLARTFGVKHVYLSPTFLTDAQKSPAARQLLSDLKRLNCPLTPISAGQRLALDNQTAVDVLWPEADSDLAGNDASQVLRLSFAGRSILFTGDTQSLAERRLLSDPDALRADILLAPHHGSAENTTQDFLRAVQPALILSSNAHRQTLKQKHFDALAADTSTPLFRTHDRGAITFQILSTGEISISDHLHPAAKPLLTRLTPAPSLPSVPPRSR